MPHGMINPWNKKELLCSLFPGTHCRPVTWPSRGWKLRLRHEAAWAHMTRIRIVGMTALAHKVVVRIRCNGACLVLSGVLAP